MLKPNTLGEWAVKDIITHLAVWNWKVIDEVDRVLKNKSTGSALYESRADKDEFNRKAVEKSKGVSWQEALKDRGNSFWAQIKWMEVSKR